MHPRSARSISCLLLLAALGSSQTLVRDIRPGLVNPSTAFSSDRMFVDGGRAFFGAAPRGSTGSLELHVTDGTAAGTRLVREIDHSLAGADPRQFARLANGTILFGAKDSQATGAEIYRTDGTVAGTTLIRDISPGDGDGVATFRTLFGVLGNVAVFIGDDVVTSSELWITDGTPAGTSLLVDLAPGPIGAVLDMGSVMQGRAFFRGPGDEPWVTDGTPAGTVQVADINPNGSSSPTGFTTFGNLVLFSATDGVTGLEPWRTDGTAAGTFRIADIASGSSLPTSFTVVGSSCFFVAGRAGVGKELWITDGTTASLVKDIRPGSADASILRMYAVGGMLMFTANDGTHGVEPWSSDGTTAGTQMVADLTPGAGDTLFSFSGSGEVVVGNQLVFAAGTGGQGREPWISDGTASGTRLLRDIFPGASGSDPNSLTAFQGGVLFNADDGINGRELWYSDLTPAGTALLAELSPPTPAGSGIAEWIALGERLWFNANDGVSGDELWISDGTPSGTQLLLDINPAPGASGSPRGFIRFGSRVVFHANGPEGNELWISDGTSTGTHLIADVNPGSAGSGPRQLCEFQGAVYFGAQNSLLRTLWRTDGTSAGTVRIGGPQLVEFSPNPIGVVGTRMLMLDVGSLWSSDGTTAGTVRVEPTIQPNSRAQTLVHGGACYFFGTRYPEQDLWRSDGTAAGTIHLGNLLQGGTLYTGDEYVLAGQGGHVFIRSSDGRRRLFSMGREMYVTDGTPAGTGLLADIWPGASSSLAASFVATDDALFFTANDGLHGRELWRSDGTAAGTGLVTDIVAGPEGGVVDVFPLTAVGVGTRVVFAARTSTSGKELWVSDGTAAGTHLLFEVQPGPGHGIPVDNGQEVRPPRPIAVGDRWFFVGDDGTTGRELFSAPLATLRGAHLLPIGAGCAGTGGLVPRISASGIPVPGRTFATNLTQAAPSSAAVLLLASARLDVPIGGGCTVYAVPPLLTLIAPTSPGGTAALSFPVPNAVDLVGAELYWQWAVVDTAGSYLNLLSFSDGMRVLIGQS